MHGPLSKRPRAAPIASGLSAGDGLNFTRIATSRIDGTGETHLIFVVGVSDRSFLSVGRHFHTPDPVDVTVDSNVTSIRIHHITDGAGLGFVARRRL